MGKLTILLLLSTAIVLGNANAMLEEAEDGRPCFDRWEHHNLRSFTYESTPRTWVDAEKFCVLLGGNLASVHSAEENAVIRQLMANTAQDPNTAIWIGGTDIYQNRVWVWSDGTKFDYYNWGTGEPNNYGGREPCIVAAGNRWNDIACGNVFPFVCSKRH